MKTSTALMILGGTLAGFAAGILFTGNVQKQTTAPVVASSRSGSLDNPSATHVQKDLKSRLDRAKSRIQTLEDKNRVLAVRLASLDVPLAARLSYADVMRKIDTLSERSLRDKLGYVFTRDMLDAIDDPRALSRRAVDVALEEEPEASESVHIALSFSTSPIPGIRTFTQAADLGRNDAVFVHLQTSDPVQGAVVKWQNLTTGEILLFGNQAVSTGSDTRLFLRPEGGWSPGTYQVSLYSMDKHMRPYGASSYQVVSVVDDGNSMAQQQVVQDLIAQGKAVPKVSR